MIMTGLRARQARRANRSTSRRRIARGILLVAAVALAGCGSDDSDDSTDSDPAAVIEDYRIAYNGTDIESVMVFFSEDSVILDHPSNPKAASLLEIRGLQISDMGQAADADAYKFSNVEVSGDTVTWDHVWTNNAGTDYCAEGNNAVITNGQIETWTFGADPRPCA